MDIVRPGLSKGKTVLVLFGAVSLVLGIVAIFYGEFSTSIGIEGVIDYGISGIGFLLFTLCILVIFGILLSNIKDFVPHTRDEARAFAHECGVVLLNVVLYGGSAFVALGALSALDRTIAAPLIAIALCIVVFVLYRRHRKRNKISYKHTSQVGMLLFFLLLSGFGLLAGITIVSESATDLKNGPQTIDGVLSDAKEDRPRGRYSSLSATTVEIEFKTIQDEAIHLSIKQQDKQALQQIVDTGGYARVTFYPKTQVFVEAQPL
ncbi:MAG: hypothetical protein RR619_06835 [Raoultibacter sp.]